MSHLLSARHNSLRIVIALLALSSGASASAQPYIADVLSFGGFDRAASFARNADEAAAVVRVLWEVLLQPVATYVSVLAISLVLACALLWTAVERLAPGGAPQR